MIKGYVIDLIVLYVSQCVLSLPKQRSMLMPKTTPDMNYVATVMPRALKNALVNQASLPRKRERKIDYFKRYCDKNGNLNNSSNYFN